MSNLTTEALALLEGITRDADGFDGRFFYDAERGDIAYVSRKCDERTCDCEPFLNNDGDQDCSVPIGGAGGVDEVVGEPAARLLNFATSAPSLVRRLVEENESLAFQLKEEQRLGEARLRHQMDKTREIERLRAQLAAVTAARDTLAELAEAATFIIDNGLCAGCRSHIENISVETIDALRQVGSKEGGNG